ncbi:MAG: RsmE family RNA methyltransferase [Phycisphaerales bacterium]
MHRVHVDPEALSAGGALRVEGEEAHHALRVRRVRVGEAVELFDAQGGVAPGRLADADSRGRWLDLELTGPVERRGAPTPWVELVCPAPKGDRLATMIDQLSQLGVASWRPLTTRRSVVEPRDAKLERLTRVALEAAKQCGRAWVMRLAEITTLDEVMDADDGLVTLVGDAGGEAPPGALERVRVILGPEGGLTGEELALVTARGAIPTRLGPHTMRIETAAVAAGAILMRDATATTVDGYTKEEASA